MRPEFLRQPLFEIAIAVFVLNFYNACVALERFFDQYQPGDNLLHQLTSEQERVGNFDHPLIFLADTLVKNAREEIVYESNKYNLSQTPEQETGLYIYDATIPQSIAIVYGSVIKGFMDWSDSGIYDYNVLVTRINNAFVGTPLPSVKKTSMD